MRVESAGTMPPSQGGGTGSIPVTRSKNVIIVFEVKSDAEREAIYYISRL